MLRHCILIALILSVLMCGCATQSTAKRPDIARPADVRGH